VHPIELLYRAYGLDQQHGDGLVTAEPQPVRVDG